MADNDNAIPFRADVSPALHPGSLEPHAKTLNLEKTAGVAVLQAGRVALTHLSKELAMIADAKKAAYAQHVSPRDVANLQKALRDRKTPMPANAVSDGPNGMVIPLPPKIARDLNAAIQTSSERALRIADAQLKHVKEVRDGLAKTVTEKIADPNAARNAPMAAEIRAHLKAMKPADKTAFLHERVQVGDLATVHAALSGVEYLSGMSTEGQAQLRRWAESKFAPVEAAQRDASDAVATAIMNAGGIFIDSFVKHRAIEPAPDESPALAKLRAGGGSNV